MTRRFIGIDPGKTGGIVVLDDAVSIVGQLRLEKATHAEIARFLKEHSPAVAILEKVGASPQMGRTSAFTFGRGYGWMEMALEAMGIPHRLIPPQTWMKTLNCMSGGDKAYLRQEAQRIFPEVKVFAWNADALLIASYCKIQSRSLFPQEAEASR